MRSSLFDFNAQEDNKSSETPEGANYMLCLALDVGEQMLQSGGEINRVEDTVERICRAYGAVHVEVFCIPSLMLAAVRMGDGEYSSQMRRIYSTENNLFRLELFNGISRRICKKPPSLEEFDRMIREAKTKKAYPKWVLNLAAVCAAGAFAVFFGGSWRDGLAAGIIGAIIFMIDQIPFKFANRLAKTVLQSFVGGLLACLSVSVGLGENSGIIMIGTIMLLVPGVFLGTALRDLLCGDFLAGSLKTVQACLAALMIAFGYLLAMFLVGGAV